MLETAYSMLGNIPMVTIAAILAGILRNISGWLVNSYKDGKVDEYEIKQLFGTIVQYFASILLLMTGMSIEQAVAGSFVLDVGASALKKSGKAQ